MSGRPQPSNRKKMRYEELTLLGYLYNTFVGIDLHPVSGGDDFRWVYVQISNCSDSHDAGANRRQRIAGASQRCESGLT